MSNEEIKAPVIEGFEVCDYDEWSSTPTKDSANIHIEYDTYFYYKRIKPKEKTIREIVEEESQGTKIGAIGAEYFIALFERILKNYVKKEG